MICVPGALSYVGHATRSRQPGPGRSYPTQVMIRHLIKHSRTNIQIGGLAAGTYTMLAKSRDASMLTLTPIDDLYINADLLPSALIYPRCPNLLPTQRVLVRVRALLHSVEQEMRHSYNSIFVGRVDTACAEARSIVGQIASEVIGIAGEWQESGSVLIIGTTAQC